MKHPLKLAVIFMLTGISLILFGLSGCTYNRNAPLINVQDSANGNTTTVPVVGP